MPACQRQLLASAPPAHQRAACRQRLQQRAVGQLRRSTHKAAADEVDEAAGRGALGRVEHKAALHFAPVPAGPAAHLAGNQSLQAGKASRRGAAASIAAGRCAAALCGRRSSTCVAPAAAVGGGGRGVHQARRRCPVAGADGAGQLGRCDNACKQMKGGGRLLRGPIAGE